MKPWKTLDRAKAPGGSELVLSERDGEFVIRVDGKELMSSRTHGSEEAMASEALSGFRSSRGIRVLVGGLGMGYTLRAVLDLLPPDGKVTVAELSTAVVRWNREVLAPLANAPLSDPRVLLEEGDVLALMKRKPAAYDAILLDVDNGPVAVTTEKNSRLYTERGVALCRDALSPRGRFVVWSAGPDEDYLRLLDRSGLKASTVQVKARAKGSKVHVLFIGRR